MAKPSILRLLVLALLCVTLRGARAQEAGLPAPVEERLTIERARLIAANKFYLEISLSRSELRLCHSGVALATYHMTDLSVGRPRVLFVQRGIHGAWIGAIWMNGQLDPERVFQRVKIVPGDASTIPTPDTPGVIPPKIEDLIAVPPKYEIRFEGGEVLSVEMVGEVTGAKLPVSPFQDRWHRFLQGLGLEPADALRVKVTLSAEDGAALFRSFPEAPPELLVLP